MAVTDEMRKEIDELWESYFYPGTNTLRNKLNIIDHEELKEKEAELTFEKLVELYENPIKGKFDIEHWKAIHKYIFGDIYEWAGNFRNVNMRKETDFTDYKNIEYFLKGELDLMQEELKTLRTKEDMARLLATYYFHLIQIHPFREGNGRSCREFLRELVAEKSKELTCGPLELDWTKFDGEVFMDNLQFAFVFRSAIENEFFKTLVPAEPEEEYKIKM